jgi:hypothetical protein
MANRCGVCQAWGSGRATLNFGPHGHRRQVVHGESERRWVYRESAAETGQIFGGHPLIARQLGANERRSICAFEKTHGREIAPILSRQFDIGDTRLATLGLCDHQELCPGGHLNRRGVHRLSGQALGHSDLRLNPPMFKSPHGTKHPKLGFPVESPILFRRLTNSGEWLFSQLIGNRQMPNQHALNLVVEVFEGWRLRSNVALQALSGPIGLVLKEENSELVGLAASWLVFSSRTARFDA